MHTIYTLTIHLYIALRLTAQGYFLCQIWLDERRVVVYDRMMKEGMCIGCMLYMWCVYRAYICDVYSVLCLCCIVFICMYICDVYVFKYLCISCVYVCVCMYVYAYLVLFILHASLYSTCYMLYILYTTHILHTGIKIIVDQYGLSEPLFLDKQSLGAFRSDFNFKLEDIFKGVSTSSSSSSSSGSSVLYGKQSPSTLGISIIEINNYNTNNLFLNEVLRQSKIKFLIHNDHTNLLTIPPTTATDLDTPNPNPNPKPLSSRRE